MAKKKSKKRLFIILGVVLVLVIIIAGVFLANKGQKPISVTTSKVERRTITQTVSAIGKIEAETEVKISSETSGEIEMLGIKEGDTVKSGRLLAKIKPDIIETQLEQFKAAAEASKTEIDTRRAEKEQAKVELSRLEELIKKNYASRQEYDRAKTALDQAEYGWQAATSRYNQALASLKQIQRSAARTTLYSPINGIVTKLDVEKGEKVVGTAQMSGTEMMRVSDLSVMNAMVDVDENDIVMVKKGDTTKVEIDALPDKVLRGIVIEIGNSAITNSLGTQDQVTNFKVKIRLIDNEAKLRPGMSCNVEILTETRRNVLAVPLQSVTIRDLKGPQPEGDLKNVNDKKAEEQKKTQHPPSIVFLKSGNKAKIAYVKTGLSDKGYIEITEGLKEGQEIISGSYIAVSKLLENDSPVMIETKKKGAPGAPAKE